MLAIAVACTRPPRAEPACPSSSNDAPAWIHQPPLPELPPLPAAPLTHTRLADWGFHCAELAAVADFRVTAMRMRDRVQRDVIALTCHDDKLLQMRADRALIHRDLDELLHLAESLDALAARVARSCAHVLTLLEEAQQCV